MNQKHIVIIFVFLTLFGLTAAGVNSLKGTLMEGNITPTPTEGVKINLSGGDKQTQNPLSAQNPNPSAPPNSLQTAPVIRQYRQFPGILAPEELQNKKADIVTDKGTISFEIYPEATKAASNFILLASDGFYDNLIFHRVVPGFVIQGGDPTGTGAGGPGYKFDDEPVTKQYLQGIVAMANSGPNTNGSQFFIMLANNPDLPPKYTIFGEVIAGQDVVNNIQVGDVMKRVSISPLIKAGP